MGRRRRLLLLPLWALLALLPPPRAPQAQNVQHTYENVKLMQISMQPTASVQIASEEERSPENPDDSKAAGAPEAETKEEEKTLNDLVGVLQDMVKDIPTVRVRRPIHTIPLPTVPLSPEPPVVMTTALKASESETASTVWVTLEPTPEEVVTGTEGTETVVVASNAPPASPTPVLETQNVTSESVVLHPTQTPTQKPEVSVSLVVEKATTQKKSKTLDQLTHGALSNLEQSLANVKKLNGILDTFTKKPEDQAGEGGTAPEKKPNAEEILDLIANLIETLKNTPSFVKEDRNLYKYIQIAETYIKEALELTEKAGKKLQEEKPFMSPTATPAPETEIPLVHVPGTEIPPVPVPETEISLVHEPETAISVVHEAGPLPVPTPVVHSISPPQVPLAKKAEDAQVEMGKLKAFINLLYGFSPHLTSYSQNTAHKKVAEDLVDRALAVLHAIKSVFCGSEEAESKQALKQLLKEDLELVNEAMKGKRAL
ncbi:uncharacterized protein LOC143827617 isoform X2 [Paroedura picta]|uniref:uncharacterized protein LOC143827617 isoform X2 n=1 Tax=Paroedura picta TaxID=143630 RepID=UPI004055E0E7